MAVFMTKYLESILETLMHKFVKRDVMDAASRSKLARIDMDKKENLLNAKKTDVGFPSRAITEKLEDKKYLNSIQYGKLS